MSEPRIISPLLDGFALGHSMSYHSGVNCYPAMRVDSDERYIVKTISIPASQTQLEALLLTGAYQDAEAARSYFKELIQGLRHEVDVLDKLATQRGFLPYLNYQVVPMVEGVGYEFYLISYYRRSLQSYLKRSPMTYLSAVNMGIDLCAALSVCREAGYLYVDLKPSNIYLSGEQEYHIGDLGFISLDSLKYASLPDRCRSNWTPPEIADAYGILNTTMDTYALGLILYQVYNNGALPFDSEESRLALMEQLANGESLPAPAYADYEMAQIIAKACAYNPEDRWADPTEMGQALISYMQRNGANDVPIGPPSMTDSALNIPVPTEELPEEEDAELPEEPPQEGDNWIDRMDAILGDGEKQDVDAQELRRILTDSDEAPLDEDSELSEETAGILSQADELIAHEAPEPAVAPEPIDVPIPDPIVLEDEEEDEPEEEDDPDEADDSEDDEDEEADEDDNDDEADEDEDDGYQERPKGRFKKVIKWIITIVILALLGTGVYYGYNEYFLQEIQSLTVTGEGDQMSVSVVTDMDQSKLSVVCVDLYGNKLSSGLIDGVANFTGLNAATQYTITLEVEGFHKLTGQTTAQHYTLPQAKISSFTAVTGAEDGSVILNFAFEGPAVSNWTLEYGPTGETPTSLSFTGTTITIPGLIPGTEYTFTLVPTKEVYLTGQTQITYVASNVIYAQNLSLASAQEGTITASWTAPEGVVVDTWTARCYNENGYDQTITVSETTASFTEIDAASEYTVEVTAAGMTQSTRTYLTANPITVSNITTSPLGTGSLSVTWEFSGSEPEGGWLVLYTVDNGSEQHVIQCDTTVAVIEPVAPGSHYDLTIQAANAVSVFGGTGSADVAQADSFAQYGITAGMIETSLCKAPAEDGWNYGDVPSEDITTTFAVGDTMGVLLHTTEKYDIEYNNIPIVYVVRNTDGQLVCINSTTTTWDAMWLSGHCDLEVPQIPAEAGSYTLEIYVNSQLITSQAFTIE